MIDDDDDDDDKASATTTTVVVNDETIASAADASAAAAAATTVDNVNPQGFYHFLLHCITITYRFKSADLTTGADEKYTTWGKKCLSDLKFFAP